MKQFRARLRVEFGFESAHAMPNFPLGHPNARVHGHSYRGEAVVDGLVDPNSGFVMGYEDLKEKIHGAVDLLEHRFLNDVDGLGLPTSENLARFLFDRIKPDVPGLREITIARPSIGMSVTYYGEVIDG